jgi:ubiquinone/menaquinone biosynthesis C-methylase UbiE
VAVDVGCGTGALTRRLARRVGPTGRVVGADINAYLLREASAIAQHQELGDVIAFEMGSAEALPFPDGRFDAALACTVLEEVDAGNGSLGWPRCGGLIWPHPEGRHAAVAV